MQDATRCLLAKLVSENPRSWERILDERGVSVRDAMRRGHDNPRYGKPCRFDPTGELRIASYRQNSPQVDFADPLTRECRGIVIDLATMADDGAPRVVCRALDKFGNWFESYADDIDWETARIQRKVDGQIVKLWSHHGRWLWSTNRGMDASIVGMASSNGTYDAKGRWKRGRSALDAIRDALAHDPIDENALVPGMTYVFELCDPQQATVVRHDESRLWHITTRDCLTGREVANEMGIPHVASLGPATSLEHVIDLATRLNTKDNIDEEGFVVIDDAFHRIKVKSERYLQRHHDYAKTSLSKHEAWKAIAASDEERLHTWRENPRIADRLATYEASYETSMRALARKIESMRNRSLSFQGSRAEYARSTPKDEWFALAMIVFEYPNETTEEIMRHLRMRLLLRTLEEAERNAG